MRIRRPSATTVVIAALLVLLPALAALQYQWVGQLSTAARERLQRNMRIAAAQFRESFDGEIVRAVLSLQIGPGTAREGASDRYAERYDTWVNTAPHPQIVANVLLVDEAYGELRLRRWNPERDSLEPAAWRPPLDAWRPQFERELQDFHAGRAFDRRPPVRGDDAIVITPMRNVMLPPPAIVPQTMAPVFGFTVVELNMPYMREQWFPELAQRHFTHVEGDVYRVAVTDADDPRSILYRSDPDAPVTADQADASIDLLGIGNQAFLFGRPPRPPDDGREAAGRPWRGSRGPNGMDGRRPDDGDDGRWRLLVQHQSGSLDAAVNHLRRRNLGISFGVLLLLTVSTGLLAATTRRANRLARQQMEFVAGVSHELRTPVAVIRSAAENLSQGVVDDGDRVRRYGQLLETQARRLGEMVERVLQYAGIESGLAARTRVALAPADIVDGAIESSLTLLAPDGITIERHVASDLPPVVGDAAALRSAVQNLIANAAKYGGSDQWVGVRTELGRDRRRREVWITVSDHGNGIPAAELPHIFDPFYRGADAVARQVHGSGLGLSLVRQIVAAHGGRVTVTTRAGTGTSFTIALPAAEPDQRPSAAVANELQATHS